MDIFDHLSVTQISDLFVTKHEKGAQHQMVNRRSYGLCFCTEGKITFFHRGEPYVSDPRHVLLIPKNSNYEFTCQSAGYFPLINFQCTQDFVCDSFISIEIADINDYMSKINALVSIGERKAGIGRMKALSLFYDIIGHVIGEASLSGPTAILQGAISYLEAHYCDVDLSNERLAQEAYISEVYFRRLFRLAYGTTPKQYIKNLRIAHAKELLKSHALPIGTVAENSGYTNVYHFCRDFKKAVGCTPTSYRQTHTERLF